MIERSRRIAAPALLRERLRQWWHDQPVWMLFPALVLVVCAVMTTGSIVDPDTYWHVLMGRDIWTEHRLTGDPEWTFGPHEPWRSTQWLSELVMAAAHHVGDWAGLTAMRAGAAALTATALAWVTLRGGGRPARHVVFGISVLVLAWDAQERPGTLAFPLVVVLGAVAARWLSEQRLPRPVTLVALTVVWANLHGTWVLVPLVCAALAVIEVAARKAVERALVGRAFVTAAAGLITPLGWDGVTAFARIRAAASPSISEWQPSSIQAASFTFLLLLVALIVMVCATSAATVPVAPLLWVLFCAGFAATAYRNIAVSTFLLAPVAANLLARYWPQRPRPAGVPVRALALVLALVVAPLAGVTHLGADGGVPSHAPTALIRQIGSQGGERRVLTEYALFGTVQALSRSDVATALDGRTDRYGAARIEKYTDMLDARPGWQEHLDALAPTDALLLADTALVDALTRSGWDRAATNGAYVWLRNTDRALAVMPPPD